MYKKGPQLESSNHLAKILYEDQIRQIDQGIDPFSGKSKENETNETSTAIDASENPGTTSGRYVTTVITCDVCKSRLENLPIYHCSVCSDYDLCERCFLDKKINAKHQINHPMIKLVNLSNFNPNLLTLDKLTQLFAKVEYDEKERCVFCSERLKGLSFRIGQKMAVFVVIAAKTWQTQVQFI